MKFSIIVPVYNIKDWLSECVESILRQKCSDFELLLVDDGSTDGSETLCDQYQEKYTMIQAFHKLNGGLSDARNYGIERATGDYLLFIDGDDYVAEWMLSDLEQIISEYEPEVILSEGMYSVSSNGIKEKKSFNKIQFQMISGVEALLKTTKMQSNWSAWGKCYKRSFWIDNHFKFLKGRLAEDMQLIDHVVLAAGCIGMTKAFYYYREREGSIVHSVNEKMLEDLLSNLGEWKVFLDTEDLLPDLNKQIRATHAEELCHGILGYIYLVEKKYRKKLLCDSEPFIDYLHYNDSKECKMILVSIKIIGLSMTCRLLSIIKKARL